MPWESGPRGRPYYTRTRRENGRVIREYIGVGEVGQRAAEEDETRRRQAEADREADRALAEEIRSLSELADLLARAALLAAGYHRPNRGPWKSAVSGKKFSPNQLPVRTYQPTTGGRRRATLNDQSRAVYRPTAVSDPYVSGQMESIGIRRTVDR